MRFEGDKVMSTKRDQINPGQKLVSQLLLLSSLLLGTAWVAVAQTTFTVTKTADTNDGVCDSDCSLREAINAANTTPGQDTIVFKIGSGPKTIMPLSTMTIVESVIIDGTTQPGFAGSPIIEIDGTNAGVNVNGLRLIGDHCTIRSLVINRYSSGYGIEIGGTGHHLIVGNFIGTDISGTLASGNFTGLGILSEQNIIGGPTPADRNVISGNSSNSCIAISSQSGTGNLIQGNYIGTDITGTLAIGNSIGVFIINNGDGNVIGGSNVGAGNLISGNFSSGISLNTNSNHIQGNYIGTKVDGTIALPNQSGGIDIFNGHDNVVGGTNDGEC